MARLARRPVVVAVSPARAARIETDLDQLAGDAGVRQPVERALGQVGRQLYEREVRTDLNRAEVAAAETALVREGSADLARLTPVALAAGEPIGGHPAAARPSTAFGTCPALIPVEPAGTIPAVAAVIAISAGPIRLGLEQ